MNEHGTEMQVREREKRKVAAGTEVSLKGGGVAVLRIKRGDGSVETVIAKNLITDLGLDILVRNLGNINPVSLSYVVVSDATTNPSPNETTMPGTNKWALQATVTRPSDRNLQWSIAFPKGAIVGTIGSIGICSDSAGNNLFARIKVDPPKPVGSDDTVEVAYLLVLNRSS